MVNDARRSQHKGFYIREKHVPEYSYGYCMIRSQARSARGTKPKCMRMTSAYRLSVEDEDTKNRDGDGQLSRLQVQ